MASHSAAKLLKRSEASFQNKDLWRGMLDDAYKHTHPQQNLYDNSGEGQNKVSHLFDGTGVVSTRRATNKFINTVFPAEQNWAILKAGPAVPKEKIRNINQQYQKATEMMFSVIHNRSNFQQAVGEMVYDLWITTGVMTVQKGKSLVTPVTYTAIPQMQVGFEEGPNGTVGAKFRRFDLPGQLIVPTWRNAKLSDELKKQIADDGSKKHQLTEITYTDYEDINEPVYYCVVHNASKTKIVDTKLRMDRFVVARLGKNANEVQGRGPVLDALPDLKTMNKLVELVLKNATLAVSGAYTVVDDGVINPDNVVIGPLRMIPVARNAGHPAGPSIAPLERSGQFDIAYLEYERLQKAVRSALLDDEIPDYSGAPKTAAEILQRVRAYIDDLAAYYGRIKRELIVPIVQNTLDIMAKDWQMIDEIVIDGNFVNLELSSPLSTQQAVQEVEAMVQAMEISKAMFGPEQTQLAFKVEEIIPWIARKLNIPEDKLRDPDEQKAITDGAAQAITRAEEVAPGTGLNIAQQALR